MKVSPNAELKHVIYAASWDDAMKQYYSGQEWGTYTGIPGVTDEPYTQEQRREQELYRP